MIIGIILAAALVAIGIWQRGIVFGVIAVGGIIAVILFLLWRSGRLWQQPQPAQPQQLGQPSAPPAKKPWFSKESKQALWIGALVTSAILLMCREPFMGYFASRTGFLWIVIVTLLIAGLYITGKPEPFIKSARSLAKVMTWVLVPALLVWPAAEKTFPRLHLKEIREAVFSAPESPLDEKAKIKPAAPATKNKTKAVKTVVVPAGAPIVRTGLYIKEGQSVEFFQDAPRQLFLRGVQYDVPVKSTYWQARWILPGEIQFRGGPEATTVRIKLD